MYQNPYIPFAGSQMAMNPYQGMPAAPQAPSMQVTKVNGENGARSYQLGPNSSALLLDESGLMVWLVTTDGAAYKTVTAYDITPHQEAPKPDWGSLEARITKLEGMINVNATGTADSATTRRKPGNKADDSAD